MTKLAKVSSSQGAPMGRIENPHVDPDANEKWTLKRVRINNGGYDDGGAYWGYGQPLFWACSETNNSELFFRATSRGAAKEHIRSLQAKARFYN